MTTRSMTTTRITHNTMIHHDEVVEANISIDLSKIKKVRVEREIVEFTPAS